MRALFAVVCFLLFFAISAATVVGLGTLGITLFQHLLDVRNVRAMVAVALAAAASLIAAGIIVWSVLPRFDRFEPPGPEVSEREQPRLFAEIRKVAEMARQKMPSHVYLVLDCNAFVAERGGLMGIGSRRVMGIGLALLSHFSTDELRAVIAHEFGHFDGGDTKLGPWVYRTRSAMGRTVTNLYDTARALGEHSVVIGLVLTAVAAPFKWMALGYMRVAQAVSRQQEYAADALAARLVGAGPLVSGFEKLGSAAAASDAYLDHEIGPLVSLRVAPPFFAGLAHFAEKHRDVMREIDQDSAKLGEADPFDSHPPLSARIEAVRALPGSEPLLPPRGDDQPAVTLLVEPEAVARRVMEFHADFSLEELAWEQTGPLLLEARRTRLAPYLSWLRDRSLDDVRWKPTTVTQLLSRHPQVGELLDQLPAELGEAIALGIFVDAFLVALADVGYEARSAPGEPLLMVRDDRTIDVAAEVGRLKQGELHHDAWCALWAEAGLEEHPWAQRETKPKRKRRDRTSS